MSNSARLQLGFSPLSKTIMLAKMRDVEGGEIAWELDDGSRMVLKSEKQEATSEQD
ncbi:hypothetical protein KB281_003166 [Escherichia coli]|uniref:hypothetical protein n=1 Tax=Escherichia coli TaxID=562 RepID=UPI0015607D0F|nr:hypothetical protein [Escherichia coli]EHJ8100858.1 hypothetical protein [Escherichia coli]EHK1118882.1 hypothetical protein [Escherichia coli]EHK6413723.1 hypothetical protein [Escherichia coli]EHK6418296.1 hypothetical protein [Escherichia coli]EHK7144792.1 hypothetical protein [Escherichia coli]